MPNNDTYVPQVWVTNPDYFNSDAFRNALLDSVNSGDWAVAPLYLDGMVIPEDALTGGMSDEQKEDWVEEQEDIQDMLGDMVDETDDNETDDNETDGLYDLFLEQEKERLRLLALAKEKERLRLLALAKEKERLRLLALAKEKERLRLLALAEKEKERLRLLALAEKRERELAKKRRLELEEQLRRLNLSKEKKKELEDKLRREKLAEANRRKKYKDSLALDKKTSKSASKSKKKKAFFWIAGGVFSLVLIGFLIYFIMTKK